jgi:DnaJ-class molecular chaperone
LNINDKNKDMFLNNFQFTVEAFNTLYNKEKREKYDIELKEFEERKNLKRKRESITANINCTLEELYQEKTKKIKIKKNIIDEKGEKKIEYKILDLNLKDAKNDEICFKNEGDQSPNYESSDLIFKINILSHSNFQTDSINLYYTKEISLLEALLSNLSFSIITLDNRILNINIKDIIQPNYFKCIIGEGLKNKNNGKNGDLIINFKILFPKCKLNTDQIQLLENIL